MSSSVLAGPPGDSCFSKGVQHTGTPVGKTVQIADFPTYLSEPRSPVTGNNKVILYFSDIHGPLYVNNKLIQDYFSEAGFYVLGIDYFDGDPIDKHTNEENFDRQAWRSAATKRAKEWIPKWFDAIKESYGTDAKYCAVGYCFGAPYALEFANKEGVAAVAFAHPSSLNEDHFRSVKTPLLMSCAETDSAFPLESRRRAEDILVELKAKYFIQVFSGVKHGFAVRGDPDVPDERWAKEESARGILAWFTRFAKGVE
ncbi:alpha/beta-hydrolase [Dendrothele bispora CBS 962.96]|uniref:Alpha/beta-hydrolase n=1 Tax=Dendrothele bispora (strain CBS 962.96) TaxID=1314807 RepID=A0A4S8LQ17_DENBC|nr:alpha/beta-hydrolase [Dendrothele bispora CBS 962.96]